MWHVLAISISKWQETPLSFEFSIAKYALIGKILVFNGDKPCSLSLGFYPQTYFIFAVVKIKISCDMLTFKFVCIY